MTGTLADIAARAREAGIKPPAVLVVGGVVELRERLTGGRPGPCGARPRW